MNAYKWVQLVCTIILSVTPLGFELRNWKFNDKRKRAYHRITRILLIIWPISCVGIGWAMYGDLSRKEKTPAFFFCVNNLRVEEGGYVTFPMTNDLQELTFSIGNEGNLPADGLAVTVSLPSALSVAKFNEWEKAGSMTIDKKMFSADLTALVFNKQDSQIIGVTQCLVLPPLTIGATNQIPSVNMVRIEVSARNASSAARRLAIHLIRGNGEPHIGF